MHGVSKNDQEIAYNVMRNMFSDRLAYLGGGFDAKEGSFTQLLASGDISKYVKVNQTGSKSRPSGGTGNAAGITGETFNINIGITDASIQNIKDKIGEITVPITLTPNAETTLANLKSYFDSLEEKFNIKLAPDTVTALEEIRKAFAEAENVPVKFAASTGGDADNGVLTTFNTELSNLSSTVNQIVVAEFNQSEQAIVEGLNRIQALLNQFSEKVAAIRNQIKSLTDAGTTETETRTIELVLDTTGAIEALKLGLQQEINDNIASPEIVVKLTADSDSYAGINEKIRALQ